MKLERDRLSKQLEQVEMWRAQAAAKRAQLEDSTRAAVERAEREWIRGRKERARAEEQRAHWTETARLEERARAQRAELERQRGREEAARTESRRTQWAEIARLEERARAAERHARWEQQTQFENRAPLEEKISTYQARSARFLLAIVVRLLPPSERDRYLEEFRAELLDTPASAQWSHALSLLRGVVVLRLRGEAKKKGARRVKD